MFVFQPSVMKLKTPPKGRETIQDEDYEAKLVSDTDDCNTMISTVPVLCVVLISYSVKDSSLNC